MTNSHEAPFEGEASQMEGQYLNRVGWPERGKFGSHPGLVSAVRTLCTEPSKVSSGWIASGTA